MSSKLTKLSDFVANRFGVVIAIVLLLTLMFTFAWQTIDPNTSEEAMESDSDLHRAYRRYEDSFRPSMHGVPFVLTAKDGNILNMEEMQDIANAMEALASDETIAPLLVEFYDDNLKMNITSIQCTVPYIEYIMDGESQYGYDIGYHTNSVDGNNFSSATDDDLNYILDYAFEYKAATGAYIYREVISAELTNESGRWDAPVMMVFIAVDNNLLEQNYTYDLEESINGDKKYFEEFDLYVLEVLKDNINTCQVNGVGVGINEQINEGIMESIPFIMFTFIVIIIILGITFRHNPKSFIAVAIGLPLIVIWMLGSERLLDLSKTTFNAFLPILIMALGVDYAIHSMKRYDEELLKGKSPRDSVRGTIFKLTGTLALAMVTTFVAFTSNVLSSIPALRDWGLEAGLAIIWTFFIMGLFVPALRLGMESKKNRDVPYFEHLKSSKKKEKNNEASAKKQKKHEKIARNRLGNGLSKATNESMAHPSFMAVVLVLLVVPLGYGALNIGSDFEVEEFFNPESDLVVGLDIYTEHFPTGGEPNILLIEGDIADPEVMEAINTTRGKYEARNYATWYGWDIAMIIQNFTENYDIYNYYSLQNYGVEIPLTDNDNNKIPDEKYQIVIILQTVTTSGLWSTIDGSPTMFLRPDDVQEVIHYNEKKQSYDKTIMVVGVSGSGSLDVIKEGMDNMEKDAQVIEDTGKAEITVTGTAPLRYEQLTAISDSMQYSIIISIIACFIILLIVFRKLAFSLIAILPVILIAIWLYGIMYYTGYNLNIVTATIGAMSIGVGVDYSIHVCNRFRREKAEGLTFKDSMHETISNSGAALLFAALTTSFGFFVMLFAPMPMFFAFGLFSGLMVIFAFIASVIVVPPLVRLVEREK